MEEEAGEVQSMRGTRSTMTDFGDEGAMNRAVKDARSWDGPQLAVSKQTGTSLSQSQAIEFGQEPE